MENIMTRIPLAVVVITLAFAGPAAAVVAPEGRLELKSRLLAGVQEPAPRAAGLGELRLHLDTDLFPDVGGGDMDTMHVLGFLVGLFVGFGLGHFIIGDFNTGVLFLVLELVLFAVGFGGGLLLTGSAFIFYGGGGILWLLVRIWEVVDLAFKTVARGAGGGDGVRDVAPAMFPEPTPNFMPAARLPVLSVSF
jgi:hypothetical protein